MMNDSDDVIFYSHFKILYTKSLSVVVVVVGNVGEPEGSLHGGDSAILYPGGGEEPQHHNPQQTEHNHYPGPSQEEVWREVTPQHWHGEHTSMMMEEEAPYGYLFLLSLVPHTLWYMERLCMCGGGEPCMHEHVEEEVKDEVPMGGRRKLKHKMIDPGKL